MATRADFDFSAEIIMAGGAAARRNWEVLEAHTVAEWSCDLEATMATITRRDPFQIMYATGLDVRGFDAVREFYRRRFETFQGQGFFARRWVVSDSVIVGNGLFRGTPRGTFFGTPTTGKRLCLPMTVWVHFEDELLKGEASYLDGAEEVKVW
ncbi:ester cyclase [Roseomonas sp. AR75]|uniref:ester cyclase n=1 Tax=Roseomonas sp. AR75 TaxID=2562311 RepID=UPI0010C136E2|nr:ester cyclase [Roseomonas sp. AR75]